MTNRRSFFEFEMNYRALRDAGKTDLSFGEALYIELYGYDEYLKMKSRGKETRIQRIQRLTNISEFSEVNYKMRNEYALNLSEGQLTEYKNSFLESRDPKKDLASSKLKAFIKSKIGLETPSGHVGSLLFPETLISISYGQALSLDGGSSLTLPNTLRAPGTQISGYSLGTEKIPVHLESHSLSADAPIEYMEDLIGSNIDGEKLLASEVFGKFAQRLEYDRSQKARSYESYETENRVTLSGSSQWNDEDSTPTQNIKTGKQAIKSKIGHNPNLAILSENAFNALQDHPDFSHVDAVTPAFLSQLWDIDLVAVGKGAFIFQDDSIVDMWGKDVILAYNSTQASIGVKSINYGCTYVSISGMDVKIFYQHENHSFTCYLSEGRKLSVLNPNSGYMIRNAVA